MSTPNINSANDSSQSGDQGVLPPVVNTESLFRTGNMVLIEHQGQRYQLRITRENKLILTK